MMILACVLVYFLIAGLTVRPVAGHLAWKASKKYRQVQPDRTDWNTAYTNAFFLGLFWAPVLLGFGVTKAFGSVSLRIGEEKKAIERQRIEALQQLERELDL